MKKNNSKRGFTLIELLVVVAVIGLISTIVLASIQSGRIKAKNIAVLAAVKQLRNAIEVYKLNNGSYPAPAATYAMLGPCPTGGCLFQSFSVPSANDSSNTTFASSLAPYMKFDSFVNTSPAITISSFVGGAFGLFSNMGSTNFTPWSILYWKGLPYSWGSGAPYPYNGTVQMAEIFWIVQGNNSQCSSVIANANRTTGIPMTAISDGNYTVCQIDLLDN